MALSEKIKEIMNAFGFDIRDTLSLHVNLPVVEETDFPELLRMMDE